MKTGWKVNQHLEGFAGEPYEQPWDHLVQVNAGDGKQKSRGAP
jgi:hypothetical protein